MGGGNLDADASGSFGDDGVAEADGETAHFEESFAHGDGGGGFSHDNGADGGG